MQKLTTVDASQFSWPEAWSVEVTAPTADLPAFVAQADMITFSDEVSFLKIHESFVVAEPRGAAWLLNNPQRAENLERFANIVRSWDIHVVTGTIAQPPRACWSGRATRSNAALGWATLIAFIEEGISQQNPCAAEALRAITDSTEYDIHSALFPLVERALVTLSGAIGDLQNRKHDAATSHLLAEIGFYLAIVNFNAVRVAVPLDIYEAATAAAELHRNLAGTPFVEPHWTAA